MPPWIWMFCWAFCDVAAERDGRGDRAGELGLAVGAGGGAGGVPGHRRGALGTDEHVREVVLDRLERADRAAELLAHLRVGQRHLQGGPRAAGRLGRDDRARDAERPVTGAGQPFGGRARKPHGRDAEGRIHRSARRRDGQPVRGHEIAVRAHGQDEVLGPHPARHEGRAGEPVAVRDDARRRSERGDRSAGGEPRKQPLASRVRAAGRDDRGADHRGQERARRGGRAEFVHDDSELGQPGARPAELLGEVQAGPAEVGGLGPVLRRAPGRPRLRAAHGARAAAVRTRRTSARRRPARGGRRSGRSACGVPSAVGGQPRTFAGAAPECR